MEQVKQVHSVSPERMTIVRVGNQSWKIGEPRIGTSGIEGSQSLPRLAESRRSELQRGFFQWIQDKIRKALFWGVRYIGRQVKSIPRTFRDSFQLGAIFGLALGTLSLFFFHQIQPYGLTNDLRSSAGPIVGGGIGQLKNPTSIPQSTDLGIHLPGLTLYSLELGNSPNEQTANHMLQQLGKKGIRCYVEKQDTSWLVLSSLAVQPDDLQSLLSKYATLKPSVYCLQQKALTVPVLATTSSGAASKTEAWIAAEASAFLTLTAVVADGENSNDAIAAYANQQKLYPGDDTIAQTGLSMWLVDLSDHVESAYQAVLHHQTLVAESALVTAEQSFMQLGSYQVVG